jgi:hypothetical protein
MTLLALMDFFGLAKAKQVMSTHPKNMHIWHAHYTTTVQCTDGSSLPANVRIFSPMKDVLHHFLCWMHGLIFYLFILLIEIRQLSLCRIVCMTGQLEEEQMHIYLPLTNG